MAQTATQQISDIAAQVHALVLLAHGAVQKQVGLHQVRRAGQATSPAESRPYQMGDDLRRLDHRVGARRDQAFIKVYEDEAALALELVVDTSNSMATDLRKSQLAQQLAVALALVAAGSQDAVGLSTLGPQLIRLLPTQTRPRQASQIAHALLRASHGGQGDLTVGLHQLAPKLRQRSVVVLLSDCVANEQALVTAVRSMARMGRQVVVGHILSPTEINFDLGDAERVELIDPETQERRRVDLADTKIQYLQRIAQWQRSLSAQLAQAGIPLAPLNCNASLRTNMTKLLVARTQAQANRRSRR